MTTIEGRTCDVPGCGARATDMWLLYGPVSTHEVVQRDEHDAPLWQLAASGRRQRDRAPAMDERRAFAREVCVKNQFWPGGE